MNLTHCLLPVKNTYPTWFTQLKLFKNYEDLGKTGEHTHGLGISLKDPKCKKSVNKKIDRFNYFKIKVSVQSKTAYTKSKENRIFEISINDKELLSEYIMNPYLLTQKRETTRTAELRKYRGCHSHPCLSKFDRKPSK